LIPLRRGCTDAPWPGGKAKAPCRRGSEVRTELLISSFVEERERAEGRVKVARKMECMTGAPEEPRRGDAHGSDKEAW
jgi:predicted MarR family transcription regulator